MHIPPSNQFEVNDDPDLVQAIEDFASDAVFIARRRADAQRLKPGSPERKSIEHQIAERLDPISLRAERLNLRPGALMDILVAFNAGRDRRGRAVPAQQTSRTLGDQLDVASAAVVDARRALLAAHGVLQDALSRQKDAEAAYAAYGRGSLVA